MARLVLLLFVVLASVERTVAPIRFRNVAAEAGIDFVLENNATPEKQLVETMAGGVAALDYDGDGLIDIFFTNGAALPSLEKNDPKFRNRLYRNLGGWRFIDVTEEAGLSGIGYSMGAAAADFDTMDTPTCSWQALAVIICTGIWGMASLQTSPKRPDCRAARGLWAAAGSISTTTAISTYSW